MTEPGGPTPATGSMWGRIGRPARWVLVGVVLLVALAVAVWPRGGAAPVVAAPAAVNLAPDREKADLPACVPATGHASSALAGVRVTCLADGATVDLGALLAGGPVLVNVWASWCQPCQQELPALDGYAHQPGAIRVVGVQVQSPQRDGLDLLAGLGVHLPMVYDGSGAASKALRLPPVLPVSYLVGADGDATLVQRPSRVLLSVADVRTAVATYLSGGGA